MRPQNVVLPRGPISCYVGSTDSLSINFFDRMARVTLFEGRGLHGLTGFGAVNVSTLGTDISVLMPFHVQIGENPLARA